MEMNKYTMITRKELHNQATGMLDPTVKDPGFNGIDFVALSVL